MSEGRLSPRAERDLQEIWLYTEGRWSAARADRDTRALIDMIDELAANPGKGRAIDNIFYRQDRPGIEVIRILHQNMDVSAHLSETD